MTDEQIRKLKERYVEVQKNISRKRKDGSYTRIAEIMLTDVPARIRMAEADDSVKSIAAVEEIFKRIEEDLKVKYP